jgi:hypothetical protein
MTDKPYLPDLDISQISRLPKVVCPSCGAALIARHGQIYTPYQALPGSWSQEFDQYFGYLHFDCKCPLNMGNPSDPTLAGSLRVARVGDAILPLEFIGLYSGALAEFGLNSMEVHTARTQQAVRFLCAHADPASLTGTDALKMILFEVAGGKSPQAAYEVIKAMLLNEAPIWKKTKVPVLEPVEA